MPPLCVPRRIDAVEAYGRGRENICPMVAVFDVPGIEPAPGHRIEDREGISARGFLKRRRDGACTVEGKSGR